MDQEKFDQHLMDYLFDDLDEVTTAAMKRQLEADPACRKLEAGLRATLEVAQLPLEEPSEDLEERILAAASLAEKGEPLRRKILRSLAWAGSHAMRPQLAMAAILMLVLGSSVLLLRARPGSLAVTPFKDEVPSTLGQGVAEPSKNELEADDPKALAENVPEAHAPSASEELADRGGDKAKASAEIDAAYERALTNHRAGNFSDARKDFAEVAASKSAKAPNAAYYEAEATRSMSGCSAAAPKYQAIMNGYRGSAVSEDAAFAYADCLRMMGDHDGSRAVLRSLLGSKAYGERAAAELNAQGEDAKVGPSAVAARKASPSPAEQAPEPAGSAPAAPPPQSKPPPKAAPPPIESDNAY